jgi:glutamate synthase domain-containing protein 3
MESSDAPVLPVAEIRDYERINSQLAQMLDDGLHRIRLTGVDGQRLLVSGLKGNWSAVIDIEGDAGPELAAGLDAPNLVVLAHGSTADGAGRNLRQGHVLILGDATEATGYRQAGGVIVVTGKSGNRGGLELSGGTLILAGPAGRLLGDRQTGGRIFALAGAEGPHAGHARNGGRLTAPIPRLTGFDRLKADDVHAFHEAVRPLTRWLPDAIASVTWPNEEAG